MISPEAEKVLVKIARESLGAVDLVVRGNGVQRAVMESVYMVVAALAKTMRPLIEGGESNVEKVDEGVAAIASAIATDLAAVCSASRASGTAPSEVADPLLRKLRDLGAIAQNVPAPKGRQ